MGIWKNRQEKYTYLFFLSVFLICLPTGTLRKTDKKNIPICFSCLFFSSAFVQIHWEKQTRKIHLFVFLVVFFNLPSYRYTEKNRQEKYTYMYLSFMSVFLICPPASTLTKTDKKIHIFVLSCLFSIVPVGARGKQTTKIYTYYFFFLSVFLMCPPTCTLGKNRQEKYNHLSFLSVFLICPPTGTLRKKDKKNIHLFVSLVCFSHLPSYRYIEKKRQEKYTYLSLLSFFSSAFLQVHWEKQTRKYIPICLSCLFISSTFPHVHWEKQTRKIHLFVFFVCLPHLHSYRYTKKKQTREISPFVFRVCFLKSHLPSYRYTEKNRQEKRLLQFLILNSRLYNN